MTRLSAGLKSFFVRFSSESAKCEACRKVNPKSNMQCMGPGLYVCNAEKCQEEFQDSHVW